MSWILQICQGNIIGAYLSDISAAFDRVFKEYLLAKLQTAGVGETFLRFLNAYLQPRKGKVVVEDTASDEFVLSNTVFQGTVLGPTLWNTFFADVSVPASSTGGQEAIFADDLNVFQIFDRRTPPDEIRSKLQECRTNVHKWGVNNRVVFDGQKEHLAIIHPLLGSGDSFKLLGCMTDVKLIMDAAVQDILTQCRPKIKALLRTRAHYDVPKLIEQFKTHIWGIMEYRNGAIYHASSSHLARIDSMQRGFLHELDIDEAAAFLEFNFAPPCLRRDIALLGFLHKRILNLAHPKIAELLPLHNEVFTFASPGHNKKLHNHCEKVAFQRELFNRSIFALVNTYNALPQHVVDLSNVASFQAALTHTVKLRCQQHRANWQHFYSPRCHVLTLD